MEEDDDDPTFHPNDIIIRMTPELDASGRWQGDVHLSLITQEENTLVPDDLEALQWLATLAVASLPLLEDNDRFRELLFKYAEAIDKEIQRPRVEKITDNVIKVNFKGA